MASLSNGVEGGSGAKLIRAWTSSGVAADVNTQRDWASLPFFLCSNGPEAVTEAASPTGS